MQCFSARTRSGSDDFLKPLEPPENQEEYNMNSIITGVILPGVGPVCPECLSRGHLPALRLSPREVYSFGLARRQIQLDWDVDGARALIAARLRTPYLLDPEWLRTWLTQRTAVTAEHLDHIPTVRLDEPGIIVEVVAGARSNPQPFRILIDGTHRAARRLRDGQDCWAYLLTEEEQLSICTYLVRGREVEVPTFPGAGIGDCEAGIVDATAAPLTDVA
jgi:hypothetical protein